MSVLRMSVSTGSDGSYTLPGLPPGSCQVTAGHATTQNFQLTGVLHQTVSGTVTGGTPTAWPTRVSWTDGNGHSGTTYTTPSTGEYSLSLDSGSYTLTVTRQHQRRAL